MVNRKRKYREGVIPCLSTVFDLIHKSRCWKRGAFELELTTLSSVAVTPTRLASVIERIMIERERFRNLNGVSDPQYERIPIQCHFCHIHTHDQTSSEP